MSSFVIGKSEYAKVAGLVAGIVTARNQRKDSAVWIFDYEKGHNMDADGYRDRFARCYEANVESVCKQYDDDPAEYGDDGTYDAEFNEFFMIGKHYAFDRGVLPKIIQEIRFFSRSVSYQIEDYALNQIVMEWFNTVLVSLFALLDERGNDHDSWGSFSLEGVA